VNALLQIIRIPFIVWMLIGAGWAYWDYHEWETTTWAALKIEADNAQAELAAAQRDALKIQEFQRQKEKKLAELQALSAQIDQMRAQYPSNPAIPQLLKDLADVADGTGLEFRSFKPQPDRKQEFVTVSPIEVDLKGTYVQIMSFLDSAANLKRAVATEGLTIDNPASREGSVSVIAAKARLVTYSVDSNVSAYTAPSPGSSSGTGAAPPADGSASPPATPPASSPPAEGKSS
jgi:type IV pilus assembly protein PilO